MKKTFIIAAAVAASIFTGSAAYAGSGQSGSNQLLHRASHWYAPVYHYFQPRRHFARHYYGRRYHGRRYHGRYHRWHRGHGGRHGGRYYHQRQRNHDMGRGRGGGGGRGGDGRRGRR